MPSLPLMRGREIVRFFEKDGWSVARQRGGHIVMVKPGHMATLSVPDHREVARGILRSLIRSSGLTVERFLVLVKGA